jgi:hypothetical protein
MAVVRVLVLVGVGALVTPAVSAQWPEHPTPNIPRTADGGPDMDAPTPRTPDGKPDLSGLWGRWRRPGGQLATPAPSPPGTPPEATFFDIGGGFENGLPFQPWAAELKAERVDSNSRWNPDALCLPMGLMQFHAHGQPRRMIQTPDLITIIYEANYGLRYIHTDGRELPPQGEPQPWWYGYSVGTWEGDELVVETNNLRGEGWLDVRGSPRTSQATFTERFRRPSFGRLEIDVMIDDPGAYTEPFIVRVNQQILVDEEMIEFICNENQQFGIRVNLDEQ